MGVAVKYGNPREQTGIAVKASHIITETGTFSVDPHTAAANTDVTIEYELAHVSAPHILVVGTNNSASVFATAGVSNRSESGATIRMRNLSSHTLAANFRWFAIEEVDG